MSLHSGAVMIRADVRDRMHEIFESFNYRPVGSMAVNTFEEAIPLLDYPRADRPAEVVHKAVVFVNGWTVIIDNEMVMLTDEQACSAVSARIGQPLFGMVCEGASGSYAFSFFNPDLRRSLWSGEGQIQDQRGTPLPEEQGVDPADIFEDDVLLIMKRLGVDYAAIEAASPVIVWELDESHIQVPAEPAPKPWWKFW